MLSLKALKHPWVSSIPKVGDKVRILNMTFNGRHEANTVIQKTLAASVIDGVGMVKYIGSEGDTGKYDMTVRMENGQSWVFYFDQVHLL